ncbi:hypothetical protein BTJ39_03595 [Izhakiella australiensis]|uniref:Uncharacterized protein n=1 Tax=Izhakiella australiensis TaxID=1926881 RepID=A0A1S8YPS9_9GAMM|nr:hypothetical protein [Izhakiella australiensis]OON41064.1 hypothetical protein BTJ39_03595 [Izhakiella australiensis]
MQNGIIALTCGQKISTNNSGDEKLSLDQRIARAKKKHREEDSDVAVMIAPLSEHQPAYPALTFSVQSSAESKILAQNNHQDAAGKPNTDGKKEALRYPIDRDQPASPHAVKGQRVAELHSQSTVTNIRSEALLATVSENIASNSDTQKMPSSSALKALGADAVAGDHDTVAAANYATSTVRDASTIAAAGQHNAALVQDATREMIEGDRNEPHSMNIHASDPTLPQVAVTSQKNRPDAQSMMRGPANETAGQIRLAALENISPVEKQSGSEVLWRFKLNNSHLEHSARVVITHASHGNNAVYSVMPSSNDVRQMLELHRPQEGVVITPAKMASEQQHQGRSRGDYFADEEDS